MYLNRFSTLNPIGGKGLTVTLDVFKWYMPFTCSILSTWLTVTLDVFK